MTSTATTDAGAEIAKLRRLSEAATPGTFAVSGARTKLGDEPMLKIIGSDGRVWAYIPYSDRTPADHAASHADAGLFAGSTNYVRTHVLARPAPTPAAGDEAVPDRQDHVASARLIPWELEQPGVEIVMESGLRVALPLSASVGNVGPIIPKTTEDLGAENADLPSLIAAIVMALPWAAAGLPDDKTADWRADQLCDRHGDVQIAVERALTERPDEVATFSFESQPEAPAAGSDEGRR